MTYTPISPGTPNWDVPLNAALVDQDTRITNNTSSMLQKANNLSDVANVTTSRANLGLGGAATLNVGTTTGTVAAGDDSRITGAAQKANNLSDLSSASNARTNLGLGGAATLNVGTTTGTVAAGDDSRITGAAQKASNLSDLASASTARTNLGLGGAATLNVGTATGTVAAGDDARLLLAYQSGPPTQGFISWNYDPEAAASSNSLTAGTVFLHKIWIPAGTVTNIGLAVSTAGVGLTSGQNFAGIYNSSGTRLAVTNDQTTNWNTTGFKTCALSSPLSVSTAGYYYVALLCNAATTVAAGSSSNGTQATFNANVTGATLRHATGPTAQTSLPASITMSSNVSTGNSHWIPIW